MKVLKAIATFLFTVFAGMYGGQKNKAVRRFGIPSFAFIIDLKRGWPMLLLIPVLIMGYGEKSVLMAWIGNETLVRLAYAFLLALPFVFYGIWRWVCAIVLLIIAFQVRAGSAGHIKWFGDILIEDLVRYSALGGLIAFNLFFKDDNNGSSRN